MGFGGSFGLSQFVGLPAGDVQEVLAAELDRAVAPGVRGEVRLRLFASQRSRPK